MSTRTRVYPIAVTVLWLVLCPVARGGQQSTNPRDWSDRQKEQFLLNASIDVIRDIGTGVTGSRRAEMDDGVTRHDAHIQTIDESQARFEGERGVELNFTDSYKYNIAAYRLDRLLGLDMVPVSVERRVGGDRAAVTWWVDDAQMTLVDFYEDQFQPPDSLAWAGQMMHIRLFNELVYNTDANQGNFVIDGAWAVHMIDFTRAFRANAGLRDPTNLMNLRISRRVFDALRALELNTLDQAMGDLLTDSQIRTLLARRDLIVQDLEAQISRRGAAGVLSD